MRKNLKNGNRFPSRENRKVARETGKISVRIVRGADGTRPHRLTGDHQIDRFGAFALLIRFDVEADPLSLVQSLQSRLFHCGDMNEHVTPAVIRFYEAIAPFAIEE